VGFSNGDQQRAVGVPPAELARNHPAVARTFKDRIGTMLFNWSICITAPLRFFLFGLLYAIVSTWFSISFECQQFTFNTTWSRASLLVLNLKPAFKLKLWAAVVVLEIAIFSHELQQIRIAAKSDLCSTTESQVRVISGVYYVLIFYPLGCALLHWMYQECCNYRNRAAVEEAQVLALANHNNIA
jgi:hypothetical protein